MEQFKKPDCSTWKIWHGPEIEGADNRGEKTLFVRSGDPSKYWKDYDRLWFCKEFRDEDVIRQAIQLGKKVCIEITEEDNGCIPEDIFLQSQLYLKIEFRLKNADHICIGTAFKDEAFKIGDGIRVFPDQYKNDVRLE